MTTKRTRTNDTRPQKVVHVSRPVDDRGREALKVAAVENGIRAGHAGYCCGCHNGINH